MSDDIRRKKKKQPRKNKPEARPGSESQARVAKGPPPKLDVGDEKEKVTKVKTTKTTEQTQQKSSSDTCTKIVFFLSILGNIRNI